MNKTAAFNFLSNIPLNSKEKASSSSSSSSSNSSSSGGSNKDGSTAKEQSDKHKLSSKTIVSSSNEQHSSTPHSWIFSLPFSNYKSIDVKIGSKITLNLKKPENVVLKSGDRFYFSVHFPSKAHDAIVSSSIVVGDPFKSKGDTSAITINVVLQVEKLYSEPIPRNIFAGYPNLSDLMAVKSFTRVSEAQLPQFLEVITSYTTKSVKKEAMNFLSGISLGDKSKSELNNERNSPNTTTPRVFNSHHDNVNTIIPPLSLIPNSQENIATSNHIAPSQPLTPTQQEQLFNQNVQFNLKDDSTPTKEIPPLANINHNNITSNGNLNNILKENSQYIQGIQQQQPPPPTSSLSGSIGGGNNTSATNTGDIQNSPSLPISLSNSGNTNTTLATLNSAPASIRRSNTIEEYNSNYNLSVNQRIFFVTSTGHPVSVFSLIKGESRTRNLNSRKLQHLSKKDREALSTSILNEHDAHDEDHHHHHRDPVSKETSYAHLLSAQYIGSSLVGDEIDVTGVPLKYNPTFLDNAALKTGKHRVVMNLPSYKISILPFTKKSAIKEELNEQFRQAHPWVNPTTGITLYNLRKIKRKLKKITLIADLDISTLALSYVLLEKMIIKNQVSKPNFRLYSACCLLLAAKFNDSKALGGSLASLFEAVEKKFSISKKELLTHEFSVFGLVSFGLFVDYLDVIPHLTRLKSELVDSDQVPFVK